MDKKTQQQPGDASLQLRTAPSDLLPQASPTQSYSSDDQSPRSGVPARRRSLPHTRSNRSPPGNINTKQPLARSTKSMSAGVRERTSHGSLMNMTGTLSAASEVTYTPTTHRISKAKKGKKVHACEYPGCSKIFTRAEHRKRHEANHNTVPLFQCEVQGCSKPFQRSDLLQRHMERQHNAPESPFGSSQYARRSIGEASLISGSPPQGSVVHSNQPQGVTSQPMTNPSGAMAIGSIIEPTMRHEYASPAIHTFAEFSHLPVPVAPRMPPELLYGISVSDSPCPSSDSSYSPMSDLIQPHINTNPFSAPDDLPRAQSVSLESTFPQHVFTSPLTATSPVPSWNFDQAPLSAPMQSSMQAAIFPTSRRSQLEVSDVPTYMDANGMSYDMSVPFPQQWPTRKMTF